MRTSCGGYVLLSGIKTAGLVYSGQPIAALAELQGQVALGTLPPARAITAGLWQATPTWVIEATRRASRGRFGVRCGPELSREPRLDTEVHHEPAAPRPPPLAGDAWGLPALLRYEDRNSMAFAIEARVPFLDYRLVEHAVRLPDRLRIDRGVTKAVLRRAMDGRLPPEIQGRRDKLGFAAPQARWLAAGREEAAAIVRGGQIVQRGWVEATEVERVLETSASGRRGMEQLWRLVIVESWLRMLWPAVGGRPAATTGTLRSMWARSGPRVARIRDPPNQPDASSTRALRAPRVAGSRVPADRRGRPASKLTLDDTAKILPPMRRSSLRRAPRRARCRQAPECRVRAPPRVVARALERRSSGPHRYTPRLSAGPEPGSECGHPRGKWNALPDRDG